MDGNMPQLKPVKLAILLIILGLAIAGLSLALLVPQYQYLPKWAILFLSASAVIGIVCIIIGILLLWLNYTLEYLVQTLFTPQVLKHEE